MVINNITRDVRVSADREDVFPNLETLEIDVRVGNGFVVVGSYKTCDELLDAYNHMMKAFEVSKDLPVMIYNIRDK